MIVKTPLVIFIAGWMSVCLAMGIQAQSPSEVAGVSARDRARILEAYRLADTVGNRIWPEWDKAPFAMLLVLEDREVLIHHPDPTGDFRLVGFDELLKTKVWTRPRVFQPELLAAFPAVNGISTIVVGRAEKTSAKTSTPWVLSVLHEHFHQLQDSQPNLNEDISKLGLARGDQTGMWMLNFPFPYDAPEVIQHFELLRDKLATALKSHASAEQERTFNDYVSCRNAFRKRISEDDYKYFSFQIWKEGIARHTELEFARSASNDYEPSPEFRNLDDFTSYSEESKRYSTTIEQKLRSSRLSESKRETWYAFGASEGLLLDRMRPDWKTRYFQNRLNLDEEFKILD